MGPGSLAFGLGGGPGRLPAGSRGGEGPQHDQQQFPRLIMLMTQWTHVAPFSQSSGFLLPQQLCRLALGPGVPFGDVGQIVPAGGQCHRPRSSKIQSKVIRTQTSWPPAPHPALHPVSSGQSYCYIFGPWSDGIWFPVLLWEEDFLRRKQFNSLKTYFPSLGIQVFGYKWLRKEAGRKGPQP